MIPALPAIVFKQPVLLKKDVLWMAGIPPTGAITLLRADPKTQGPVLFERYLKPRIFDGKTDEAAVEAAVSETLGPVLDQVEKMEGKHVLLDVRNFNGKYTLASTEIIPLEAINLTKKAS